MGNNTSWGYTAGFPDQAMTDTNGEFTIGRAENFTQVLLGVTARNLAPARVWLERTNAAQSIMLNAGVSLRGRILKDGAPVADGAIGRVVQTVGLGPHRLNRAIRPSWFFDTRTYGGILADIASHQIDQFLVFTGSRDAAVVSSTVANYALPDRPAFEDFGEILLRGDTATGYIRNDWFTPDGLPTWGDGRLFLLGTEGNIEARKYVDIAGRPGTDHVFVADRAGTRYIDASKEPLMYFRNFLADVRDRSATAMPQQHVFTVTRIALEAQAGATRLGIL